jgi:hypothetical protein
VYITPSTILRLRHPFSPSFHRCSSPSLSAFDCSLLVSVYRLVYTHLSSHCVLDDPTMSRNHVQGLCPSPFLNQVVFAPSAPQYLPWRLSLDIVAYRIPLNFSEENWDDDFEFGGPSATSSPVQSTRRRSIPSPTHSPPRAHKRTKSRGNGVNNLLLTTGTRATRWSVDTGGFDDENWDEDEPAIPPVVQRRSLVSRGQRTRAYLKVFGHGSRPAQCPLSSTTQGCNRALYSYLAAGRRYLLDVL